MRTLLFAAVALSFIGATAPVAPVTGVAYDQVIYVTRSRPLPQVTDFAKVWNDELAVMTANPGVYQVNGLPIGQARSFAWLGTNERVENPVTGGITIYRPDDRETINIDAAKHTYTISAGVPATYSVTNGKTPATPGPNAPTVQAQLHITNDTYPDTPIDGVVYKGIAGRITQTVSDPACKYAQELAFYVVFADPNRRDPQAGSDAYAFWLPHGADMLSPVSGCVVTPPDNVLSALSVYPNFVLYMVSMLNVANHDMSFQPIAAGTIANVMIRGNVRTLTDADAALFEPPAGYTKVP